MRIADSLNVRAQRINQRVYVFYLSSVVLVAGVVGLVAIPWLTLVEGGQPGQDHMALPVLAGAILLCTLPMFGRVDRLRRRRSGDDGEDRLRLIRRFVLSHLAIVWTYFGVSGSVFYLQHVNRIGARAALGLLAALSLLLMSTSVVLGRRLRSIT